LSVRELLALPQAKGGFAGFGERPPIFERSTVPELANFLKSRAAQRLEAEAKWVRSAAQKRPKTRTRESRVSDLQVTLPVSCPAPNARKVSRWDKPEEAAGEKVVSQDPEMEEVVLVCSDEFSKESEEVEEQKRPEVDIPTPKQDPRMEIGVARPIEKAVEVVPAATLELPPTTVVISKEQTVSLPPYAEQEMVKVMVNLGKKLDEVYRAHLLPLGLAPPAKPPRVCDGSCGAAGNVIDSIAIAPGSERQQRQDLGLSRSQRRSKVAKERRDRFAALEAEAALLRAKLARSLSRGDYVEGQRL
jgi:hypothetical protein